METCDFSISKQLNYLESINYAEQARLRKESFSMVVPKGKTVFMENEILQSLFCIQEGLCKFSRIDDKGKEHILKILGKGELMGRRSIISNKGALVTATTLTDTRLCSLDKKYITFNLHNNSGFCLDVLRGFISDADEDEKALTLIYGRKGMKQRLAALLCYLQDRFGTRDDGSLIVQLKREDMANFIGTSSEYIINLLSLFKSKKYIAVSGRSIRLLSAVKLRALALQ